MSTMVMIIRNMKTQMICQRSQQRKNKMMGLVPVITKMRNLIFMRMDTQPILSQRKVISDF